MNHLCITLYHICIIFIYIYIHHICIYMYMNHQVLTLNCILGNCVCSAWWTHCCASWIAQLFSQGRLNRSVSIKTVYYTA